MSDQDAGSALAVILIAACTGGVATMSDTPDDIQLKTKEDYVAFCMAHEQAKKQIVGAHKSSDSASPETICEDGYVNRVNFRISEVNGGYTKILKVFAPK